MNMKLKALVAVTAMAIASQASAKIEDSTTGNGELFLTVWDNAAKVSYTRDLGTNMNDFLAPAGSVAGTHIDGTVNAQFATDANWATFISQVNVSNLQWNVAAMDSVGAASAGGSRYLTTSNNTVAQIKVTSNSLLNGFSISNGLLTGVNAFGSHVTSGAAGDGSAVNVVADGSAYAETWYGNNWYGKAAWTTTTTVDSSLNFFFLTTSSAAGLSKINATQYGYTGVDTTFKNATFTLSSTGNLSYDVPPAVPVPAAVWLLGSALVGLVGVARRKVSVA